VIRDEPLDSQESINLWVDVRVAVG